MLDASQAACASLLDVTEFTVEEPAAPTVIVNTLAVNLAYLPGGQPLQLAWPHSSLYIPGLHTVHLVENICPVLGKYVAGGQGSQPVTLVPSRASMELYLPASQVEQVDNTGWTSCMVPIKAPGTRTVENASSYMVLYGATSFILVAIGVPAAGTLIYLLKRVVFPAPSRFASSTNVGRAHANGNLAIPPL